MKQFKTRVLRSKFTQHILVLLLVFSFAQVSLAQKKAKPKTITVTAESTIEVKPEEWRYTIMVFDQTCSERFLENEFKKRGWSEFKKEKEERSFTIVTKFTFHSFKENFKELKDLVEYYPECMIGEQDAIEVKDFTKYYRSAKKDATRKAIVDAKAIAYSLNRKVVSVLEVEELSSSVKTGYNFYSYEDLPNKVTAKIKVVVQMK